MAGEGYDYVVETGGLTLYWFYIICEDSIGTGSYRLGLGTVFGAKIIYFLYFGVYKDQHVHSVVKFWEIICVHD